MIKLQIVGHLGKDAVLNTVGGKTVINFSVAHSERYKDTSGNTVEKTTWVECAYWTERTAVHPYLKKGTLVYAEGTPDVRSYTTQDGRQGASITMRLQNVQLLGGSGGQSGSDYTSASGSGSNDGNITAASVSSIADDLPF
jgi:single-strand DNA-binding protein